MEYKKVKRLLDIAATVPAAIAAAPICGVVAVLIAKDMGRPVLFKQERPGLGGKPFHLIKFRTMRHPEPGRESDADRITPLGRVLRETSLDELPTLVNVIRGDMSLVGPRPLLMRYLDLYTPEQARRHDVLPGVTGLAQVSGRNSISWEDKFALDVEYVENQSLLLDLKILLETVLKVVKRDGISGHGHVTMPDFKGTPKDDSADSDDSAV